MNSNGQAFPVFRLLIGAIIGLAILLIIISIIGYIENWKFDVSKRMVYEGLNVAIETPNKELVIRKNLTLRKGSVFSTRSFSTDSSLDTGCITLQSSNLSVFEHNNIPVTAITMAQNFVTDVYYQCQKNDPAYALCDIHCIVSFGKPII